MPKQKTTKTDASIQDLVDAIGDLSSRLDALAPIAEIADHLNEYLNDPKGTVTSGIPICLHDISPFTKTELATAVYDAIHDDGGNIVISVKNSSNDDDCVFSVGVCGEDD